MPSPFPGMDPYLEAHWRDVHARLVIYACDALQGLLPSSLRARVEESVLLETPQGLSSHPFFPDVRVVEYSPRRDTEAQPAAGIVLAEPVMVRIDQPVEKYIEIIDRESGNRVVTVIEFLSPSNKSPGSNQAQYHRKQAEICCSGANLVEIDLNRYGMHTLAFPLGYLQRSLRTSYMACVRRGGQCGDAEVYPMPLWQRLAIIKVPLRSDDADVPLNLQALIEQCYRNGAYEGTLNYAVDPDPPLRGPDKEWADKWLLEKGLRPRRRPPRGKGKRKPRE